MWDVIGEVRDVYCGGRSIRLLQGSQDSPARPADEGRVEVNTDWLEAVAWDRVGEFLFSVLMMDYIIWGNIWWPWRPVVYSD
jgi:hypothetical protein